MRVVHLPTFSVHCALGTRAVYFFMLIALLASFAQSMNNHNVQTVFHTCRPCFFILSADQLAAHSTVNAILLSLEL